MTGETNIDYYYDSADQLTNTVQGMTVTTYTYDDNGNMLSEDDGTNEQNYEFDLNGRLTNVDDGTDDLGTYTYNPDDTRRAAVEDSTTNKFFYSGLSMIGKYDTSWNVQEIYTHGANLDEVLGVTDVAASPDVDYFYAHDGLGSVEIQLIQVKH